jgi:hypothetical protein
MYIALSSSAAVKSAQAIRSDYSSALDGLWADASPAIGRLERIAADAGWDLDDARPALPQLQYALHRAAELAAGIEPPPGTAAAHRELAEALEDARDLTGDVAALLDADEHEAAADLAHEWRASLFRVRLARRRLADPDPLPQLETEPFADAHAAAGSLALVLVGSAAFVVGAVLALWPVWAVGLGLVAAASLVYRP